MSRSISMLMLGVSSLETSVPFYRDIVELQIENQFPGFAFCNAGGIKLVLSEDLGRAITPAAGALEIILPADSVQAGYQALKEKGCQFMREPREVSHGMHAATFRDPDGHMLTLFGPA